MACIDRLVISIFYSGFPYSALSILPRCQRRRRGVKKFLPGQMFVVLPFSTRSYACVKGPGTCSRNRVFAYPLIDTPVPWES